MKTNFFVALMLIFTLIPNSQAEDELGYQGKNNDELTPESLLLKLKSVDEIRIREEKNWIVAVSEKHQTIWSFPPKTHSAYPSYVQREVIKKNASFYLKTRVRCNAKKLECDKLVKDFIELNSRVKNEINTQ